MLAWMLSLGLSACATTPLATPPGVRPELQNARWISPDGQIKWPPNDGFAGPPVPEMLPPGTLLDRFGDENGTFFSPRGARYGWRALPYLCEQQDYTIYRVLLPLPVWVGKAAPWFNEPGGATQFHTDAPAASMRQDGEIAVIIHHPGGDGSAERPCERTPR